MLVSSLPPLASGGAEQQALRLGKIVTSKGIRVEFVSAGQKNVKGKTTINGMPVARFYSFLSRLFDWAAGVKKKHQPKTVKIEYNDEQELLTEITRPVGWPTVVYYSIFYWHCWLYLWPKRKSFDIIHAHTMEWPAIVAAKLGKSLNKKVIVKDSTMNGFKSLSRYPQGKKLQQLIIQQCSFVAMTGIIEANLIREGVPKEKITRIPNGIEIPQQYKQHTAAGTMVLFVGNLYQQPAKGVDILLRAWKIVSAEIPGTVLQVVGDGDLDAYNAYAQQSGIQHSVQFLGRQQQVQQYYDAASVFVLPSRREGMSNALIEAMAYGLPCIASTVSGSVDLIEDGVNGILVPVADVTALAQSIIHVLRNPELAAKMGQQARQTIQQKATMEVVAGEYINLYRKVSGQ